MEEWSCDTLPLSLESNAEILKEGKVAQEMSKDPIVETHYDKEDTKLKRVTKKPAYLKDYV